MEFNKYQELIKAFSDENESKREKFLNSGFQIIKYTGSLSGNIKNMACDMDINNDAISKISDNIGQIIYNLVIISNVINVLLEEIIKGTLGKDE